MTKHNKKKNEYYNNEENYTGDEMLQYNENKISRLKL